MADPMSIFGAAAAVISVVDILARSIGTVRELRSQWKDVELIFRDLTTQLTALRGALIKIKEWIDAGADEVHHLLVMDLEESLHCCQMLAAKIDGELNGL